MIAGISLCFVVFCLLQTSQGQHHHHTTDPMYGQTPPPSPDGFATKIPVPPGAQIVYCPAGPLDLQGPQVPLVFQAVMEETEEIVPLSRNNTVINHDIIHGTTSSRPSPSGPCPVITGTALHPAGTSCHDLWLANPQCKAQSGPYWLDPGNTGTSSYPTYCEMVPIGDQSGGWTLVARANGHSTEFSPTSSHWTSASIINGETGSDITLTSTLKNLGWSTIPGNIIKVCYSGPNTNCATFTHSKGIPLSELFANHFAVEVAEKYTFDQLMEKFGKHLYLGRLKTEWCGINLGDLCNLAANPNHHPSSHLCRIGCIGDSHPAHSHQSCKPGSYALGIGVSSCTNHHGCRSHVTGTTKSLHYSALNSQFGSSTTPPRYRRNSTHEDYNHALISSRTVHYIFFSSTLFMIKR